MLMKLFLAFAIVPLVELVLLIRVGMYIGLANTLILVVATAMVGAIFARREGLMTIHRIRENLSAGVVPAEELLDGLLILIAALLLITPGLLTDTVGFLLLIRPTRAVVKRWLKRMLSHFIGRGQGGVRVRFFK